MSLLYVTGLALRSPVLLRSMRQFRSRVAPAIAGVVFTSGFSESVFAGPATRSRARGSEPVPEPSPTGARPAPRVRLQQHHA